MNCSCTFLEYYIFSSLCSYVFCLLIILFCLSDTSTAEIYTYRHTLPRHAALPISFGQARRRRARHQAAQHDVFVAHPAHIVDVIGEGFGEGDRKSTRLNSSH